MVFQRPNPFPTKSIADNVRSGPRFNRTRLTKDEREHLVERTLRGAGLWDEVKNRLDSPAGGLSGGQQQRLCIARALAVEPEVLLMDEPCSALDPQSTLRIEELISELKERLTIIIVTHNMQQAARVSDCTAFFTIENEGEPGRLIEHAPTEQIFSKPAAPPHRGVRHRPLRLSRRAAGRRRTRETRREELPTGPSRRPRPGGRPRGDRRPPGRGAFWRARSTGMLSGGRGPWVTVPLRLRDHRVKALRGGARRARLGP